VLNVREVSDMRPLEEFKFVEATRKSLVQAVKTEQHKGILVEIRNFLCTSAEYLQRNLPLSNDFLRNLGCIHSAARLKAESEISIRTLARKLP
jgi:hypothetical protein